MRANFEPLGEVAYKATGYKMINSIDIKRFRGFEKAHVGNCARVNLVVGENGVGKTAFLESIFLAAGGSPEVAIRMRNWRGLGEGPIQGTPEQVDEAIWRDMFHDFRKSLNISISLKGDASNSRSVTISWNDQPTSIPISSSADSNTKAIAPVSFKWTDSNGHDFLVRPTIENGQLKMNSTPRRPAETFFFPANHSYSAIETAGRFSSLSRISAESDVVDLFKEHFPRIESLSVEVLAASAMLYAKVADIPEKMPLNLMGSGMSKLASILFAIPEHKKSVVLIDELENGLYYKRLHQVWLALHSFATKYDTQIFVTTHSAECLNAASKVAEIYPSDFSVIQVGQKTGAATLRQFAGDKFVDAMKEDIEIR